MEMVIFSGSYVICLDFFFLCGLFPKRGTALYVLNEKSIQLWGRMRPDQSPAASHAGGHGHSGEGLHPSQQQFVSSAIENCVLWE